ncbi:MAG: hypothetical protein KKB37_11640, partial [Alphaproteobacteria bacterium]|nr:hypothetical protein [Alphaproteobacteria bacterium]
GNGLDHGTLVGAVSLGRVEGGGGLGGRVTGTRLSKRIMADAPMPAFAGRDSRGLRALPDSGGDHAAWWAGPSAVRPA